MRITFVIGSLEAGGAQRTVVLLCEGLLSQGHHVSVVTFNGSEKDFFELPKGIERTALCISSCLQTLIKFTRLRRGILATKPDVIVSFIETMNIMVLFAMWGTKVPVVVSERSNPKSYKISVIWKWLRWWIYQKTDRIIVQTKAVSNYFLPKFQGKLSVIPNPVIPPRTSEGFTEFPPKPFLIAVGRLYYYKGYDLLLKAFARLKTSYPDWSLIILGEGPARVEIEALGLELELGDSISLMGTVGNPYDFLVHADLFVMSSRFEGFPNALCEAMACGLPVISTDCPSGPQEIIRNGEDGILVENENANALFEAMDQLMSDKKEQKRLGSNASQIVERFSLKKIVGLWEEMIVQVISEKQKNLAKKGGTSNHA